MFSRTLFLSCVIVWCRLVVVFFPALVLYGVPNEDLYLLEVYFSFCRAEKTSGNVFSVRLNVESYSQEGETVLWTELTSFCQEKINQPLLSLFDLVTHQHGVCYLLLKCWCRHVVPEHSWKRCHFSGWMFELYLGEMSGFLRPTWKML